MCNKEISNPPPSNWSLKAANVQLAKKLMKLAMTKSLGEYVDKLRLSGNIRKRDPICLKLIADKVTIDLDMVGPLVIGWMGSDMHDSLTITICLILIIHSLDKFSSCLIVFYITIKLLLFLGKVRDI